MTLKKFTKLWYALLIVPVLFVTSCSEDPVEPIEPISSFQYEVDAADYLTVHFTSHSQDAVSWSWSFGDDGTSTEENPSHTYAAVGDYTVELTVTSSTGDVSSKTESLTITDPNEALKLLTGDVSKTWRLFREGTSMSLGSGPDAPGAYWEGLTNDGSRPCLYNQDFTFSLDGTYTFDDNGEFWGEYGVWGGDLLETCFEAIPANMVNADGADVSKWLSGTHAFTYDASTGAVTLTGEGAWIGIPKLDETASYTLVPAMSQSFQIAITEEDGYDLMNLTFTMGGDFWNFYYASYNTGTEPAVVTEVAPPPACEPLAAISPTEISHTFASNDASEWTLLQFDETSGSGLEFGVDDPTDAAATKVGKYIRNAGSQYQELQFRLDPANAINFESLTTISMEVYMPSGNAYDAATLTDNVFVGLGAVTWKSVV